MGLNSKLILIIDWDYTNSAVVKALSIDWGGSNFFASNASTSNATKHMIEIVNKNSLSSQLIFNTSDFGPASYSRDPYSANTANDVTIALKTKWNTTPGTAEVVTLVGYSIWHYPGS